MWHLTNDELRALLEAVWRGGGKGEKRAYRNARARCENPAHDDYQWYGERGIQFKFTDFIDFIMEIGPRPSRKHFLDRINNDGHYEHGNVRWATPKESAANRRDGWVTRRANAASNEARVA